MNRSDISDISELIPPRIQWVLNRYQNYQLFSITSQHNPKKRMRLLEFCSLYELKIYCNCSWIHS